MAVFVLDKRKRPLMPCSEKRARLLLSRGRAVVARLVPFTIRLKDRIGGETHALRIKLDPGSKTTGIALVREDEQIDPDAGVVHRQAHVLWLAKLQHRGPCRTENKIDKVLFSQENENRDFLVCDFKNTAPYNEGWYF